MILVDYQIRSFAIAGGIWPFSPQQVNPSSYDICIGNSIAIETPEGMKEMPLPDGNTWRVMPGDFLLVAVKEIINLKLYPGGNSVSAVARLKSGRSREGLQILRAGWAEAGYEGNLTIAMKNVTRYQTFDIFPGKRFAQLIFYSHSIPDSLYDGNYQGDTTATASRGYFPV